MSPSEPRQATIGFHVADSRVLRRYRRRRHRFLRELPEVFRTGAHRMAARVRHRAGNAGESRRASLFIVAAPRSTIARLPGSTMSIQVVSRTERIGRASVDFSQEAWRDGTLLATGTIRVGCVDRVALRPAAIPAPVLAALRRGPHTGNCVTACQRTTAEHRCYEASELVSIKQHKAWFGRMASAEASVFPHGKLRQTLQPDAPFRDVTANLYEHYTRSVDHFPRS